MNKEMPANPRPALSVSSRLVAGVVACLASCGGTEPPGGPCAKDSRADRYRAGEVLTKAGAGGRVVVRLVAAEPATPLKGDNTWTVRVEDPAGAAISGATLAVQPYMPDHQHGTSIKAVTTPLAEPGQYRITPLNLFMTALWEVRIGVTTPGGVMDRVVFGACIEG